MLALRKHLLPLFRAASPLPSLLDRRRLPLLSTSASAAASPFSLEDYLVAACGLAPAQARKAAQKAFDEASKYSRKKAFGEISHSRLNSASNPDAILGLLSGVGLSRADIAAVVAADPLLLRSSPKNIGRRLQDLRDCLGLSAAQIFGFLLVGSYALRSCDVIPKVVFFISFLGSFEQLLAVMKKNCKMLELDLERVTKPNIALLRQGGLNVQDILCSRAPWILSFNPECVKEFLLRVEELRVPRSSRLFRRAVSVTANNNKEKVDARLKFLRVLLVATRVKLPLQYRRCQAL